VGSTEMEVSEAQIAVHWREEEYYDPPARIASVANANDPAIRERFTEEHFPDCYVEYAELLTWDRKWDTVLDTSNPPYFKWWVGGKLNACFNCVDRHLETRGDRNAIVWVPELEEDATQEITYAELHRRVNEFAALLTDFAGVKTGDRVTFHLPMVPELPVAMLACARIGAVHSEVFGGFSGTACGQRMADAQSTVLITIDSYYRNGELIDHKIKADEAIEAARKEGTEVEKVLVFRRIPGEYHSESPMVEGRDFFADELLEQYAGKTVDPVSLPAEGTLFLMYTSGTTGRPKGAQHSIGGYLSYVTGTSLYYQDIHPDDTYWCFADIGWITGHSYIVYGPLALGTTSVMYEGVPTYPDPGRPWRIAEKLGVDIFHTAPTTIRMLRKLGPDEPAKYDYHFKTMTTVGEPIEPDVWRWYFNVVGKGEAAITDTWWMTETGGFLGSTLPGIDKMKPGSCGPTVLGLYGVIYDENGDEIPMGSGKAGNICMRNPWPGRMLTIWGQDERFVDTYYGKYNRDPKSTDWRDRPDRRRDQRRRAPARHQGAGVGRDRGRGGRRGGSGAGDRRASRPGGRDVRLAQAGLRGRRRRRPEGHGPDREVHRQDRTAEERVGRGRHAEDAVGQDHAPRDREHLELRRRRRRDDARESRDRRPDQRARPRREGREGRCPARAVGAGARGDQGLRPGRMSGAWAACRCPTYAKR
jgi:acetyl-CoA synthetase